MDWVSKNTPINDTVNSNINQNFNLILPSILSRNVTHDQNYLLLDQDLLVCFWRYVSCENVIVQMKILGFVWKPVELRRHRYTNVLVKIYKTIRPYPSIDLGQKKNIEKRKGLGSFCPKGAGADLLTWKLLI